MENLADKQQENNKIDKRGLHLQPFQWKKGQSGNPKGRPKGKTMKEYARELLSCQTDEEREKFLEGIDKRIIWEMAEGRPDTKTDLTSDGKPIILQISKEIAEKNNVINESTGNNSQ